MTTVRFQQEEGTLTCIPQEDLISSNITGIREEVDGRMRLKNWNSFVLDCGNIRVMDSLGMTFVAAIFKKTQRENFDFRVTHCNENLKKIFQLFHMDKHFIIR